MDTTVDGKEAGAAKMVENQPNPQNNLSPLQQEYTNAKERLNQQTATFRAFAKEGQRMLRITLVFVGLLVTAASVLSPDVIQQTIGSPTCAVNFPLADCFKIDTIALVSGIALAGSALGHGLASGNEARAIASSGTPNDINNVLSEDYASESEYFRKRLNDYHDRIEQNDIYISFLEGSLAVGKITLFISIIGLTVVTLAITTGPIPAWATTLIGVIAFYGTLRVGRSLPDQVVRDDTTFPLSRISAWLLLTGSDEEDNENGGHDD